MFTFSKGKNYVVFGDLDRSTHDDDALAQSFEVIDEIKHPKFSSDVTYDVKLLKLNESVTFNEYIQPACLPQPESTISNQLLEIGWTTTNIRNNNKLHKVKTTTISNAVCKDKFKFIAHQKKHMANIDNGNIFCTMTNDGDRDICNVSVFSLMKQKTLVQTFETSFDFHLKINIFRQRDFLVLLC